MDFKTREMTGASLDPVSSEGVVLARYTLADAGGQVQPVESASGDFTFDNQSRQLTLKAFGYSLSGTVRTSSFTMTGIDPNKFSTITITFQR